MLTSFPGIISQWNSDRFRSLFTKLKKWFWFWYSKPFWIKNINVTTLTTIHSIQTHNYSNMACLYSVSIASWSPSLVFLDWRRFKPELGDIDNKWCASQRRCASRQLSRCSKKPFSQYVRSRMSTNAYFCFDDSHFLDKMASGLLQPRHARPACIEAGSKYGKEIVAKNRVTSSLVVFCITSSRLEVNFDWDIFDPMYFASPSSPPWVATATWRTLSRLRRCRCLMYGLQEKP